MIDLSIIRGQEALFLARVRSREKCLGKELEVIC